MAATRHMTLCIAGLLMLGVGCRAFSADDLLVPFRSPSVLEDEEDRPAVGSWNYTDGNVYCILSVFAMRMTFTSDKFNPSPVVIDLSEDGSNMDGSVCDTGTALEPLPETLSIKFNDDNFNLKIKFNYDLDLKEGDRKWNISEITLDYLLDPQYFPGYQGSVQDSVTFTDEDNFKVVARVHQAFRCDAKIEQDPVESAQGVSVSIATWDLDLEAYRTRPDEKMAFPERCLVDQERAMLVPSIIGGFLLVTVVTVLVIYFLQRKQRDRGYQANTDADAAKEAEAEASS